MKFYETIGGFMTLQQLKYIVTIAEKGTISEAAKALFISQPSLTNSLKELENELQITIFHRTNKGIIISNEGDEFLGYARQVLQQMNLLEEKYLTNKQQKQKFSVSTQHYSFAVNAFVDIINDYGNKNFDFTLRETQTYEIIDDVNKMKSEIGILYLSNENQKILERIINQNDLNFEELFIARPHIFISSTHPLACKDIINLSDLKPYPYLCFEQGDHNSFYFSEEILSTIEREQQIKVRDRAILFNLAVGLNGYTVSTGIISKELNGENIISKPLNVSETIRIGILTHRNSSLSKLATAYIEALKKHI